jgi:site-specific recombinase XerD
MASIKGRLTAEVYLLFERMKSFGVSKRELKIKAIKEGKPFYHHYDGMIFSFSTFETYKPKVKRFVHWCVDRFGIEHITQIKHGMFREYIGEHLDHWKANTIKTHLAAIAKFGEGIGKAESFHRVSKQIQSQLPADKVSRPTYLSTGQALHVLTIVDQINHRYGLAMCLQLETACRVCEVDRLRTADLKGLVVNEGKVKGVVKLWGKGNRMREVTVTPDLYQELKSALNEKRKLIDYAGFRTAVYRASMQLGLKSGGTHKARRFNIQEFAGEIYKALRGQGLSSRDASANALQEANRRLGHSPARKSTTMLYLGDR